jgi:hypothetical protein
MTNEQALVWYNKIVEMRGDDEAAHGQEDSFREAVLQAVADGADNSIDLAKLALRTSEIEFARWCG